MKIGIFIDTVVFGGAESLVLSLAHGLAQERGISIELFCFENKALLERATDLNVVKLDHLNRLYKSNLTLPRFASEFAKLLKEREISLLHSHLFPSIIANALTTRLAKIPHLGTLHDTYMLDAHPVRPWLLKLTQLTGTRLVTVSHAMASHYRAKTPLQNLRLDTVWNGIPSTPPPSEGERVEARSRHGITANEFVVVFSGRLVKGKRVDRLLTALSLLDLPVKLLIAGTGPEENALREQSKALGISDRVIFAGFSSDISQILACGDCFALPSESEGLSLSIMEALRAGLPVFATSVGGNPELVIPGQTGALCEDPTEFAAAIKMLHANPDMKKRLSTNAQHRFESEFSQKKMIHRYLELYRHLLPVMALKGDRS